MYYFDNAATTYPKPQELYQNTMKIYENFGISYSRSNSSTHNINNIVLNLRNNISKLLNCKNQNIIFTPSATISLNQIIQGLDYSNIKNVYISPFEHNAVYRTILYVQKKYNFELHLIPFNEFELDEIKMNLFFDSKKPDVVISNHVSNVFGNIIPIDKIFNESKKYNAINILDGAQSVGLLDIDLKNSNIDFLVFAGHKTLYGPSGIGGFIINNENILLNPIIFGGTGINSEEKEMPNSIPEKFEVGSHNILGFIGLNLSLEWLLNIKLENVLKKEKENYYKLFSILNQHNEEIKIYKPINNLGIISTNIVNYNNGDFVKYLNENNIIVRSGLHCSPLAHKHLNTDETGTIRFSVGYFNKDEDFKHLDKILNDFF